MTKINVYVGINVQKLQFEQSNGTKGFHNGVVTYPVQATHRDYTELNLHSQKLAEKFLKDVIYCNDIFDLNVATHSDVIVNVLGELVSKKKVAPSDVTIFVLNEDNSEITHTSSFDEEGYLVNWPIGFFEYNYDEINFTINKI